MRLLLFLAFSLVLAGCTKDHNCDCVMPYQIYYLKARVVQTSDISCGLPVLDFSEDSTRIRMTTNRQDLLYSTIHLPASFTVLNKTLYVSVALLKPEEEFPCITLGIMYPHLKIADAKNRD